MIAPAHRVVLVSFGASRLDENAGAALESLGLCVDRIPAKSVERLSAGGPSPTAVLVLGRNRISEDLGRKVTTCCHGVPSLGIVEHDVERWTGPLLDHCRDVVTWPCRSEELRFRLDRLRAPLEPTDGTTLATLPMPFARVGLVGRSQSFLDVLSQIRRLGPSLAPVLIEGATGTGKELIAKALHQFGSRSAAPFVPVNCGALPDTLLENELFGHAAGAFTDARRAHAGVVEQAEGGTLFLDEIESLSPRGQVVLLRFLQDQQYRPLGSARLRRADVRVIVATNESLRSMVDGGRFREDLFFRLHLVPIHLPPLRDRKEDIPILARHFVNRLSPQYGAPARELHPAMLAAMSSYHWPGNVRELENFVHRCILMAGSHDRLLTGDPDAEVVAGSTSMGPDSLPETTFSEAKQQAILTFERSYLTEILRRTRGNVSEAARLAGKERRALGKLLKKHGIERGEYLPHCSDH